MFHSSLKRFSLIVFFIFIFTTYSYSGDGDVTYDSPHKLNLNLLFLSETFSDERLEAMRNVLKNASKLLCEATHGQVYIAKVTYAFYGDYVLDTDYLRNADIVVIEYVPSVEDPIKDTTVPSGGRIGISGNHISLERIPDDIEMAGSYFSVVHELGHYVFGLKDEYDGGDGPDSDFCVKNGRGIVCIMDGGISKNINRTEFCTQYNIPYWCKLIFGTAKTQHTLNNDQQRLNHMSCWQYMATHSILGTSIRLIPPTSFPLFSFFRPRCRPGLNWIRAGSFRKRALVLDRSSSMSGSKLNFAKIAVNLFIDLLKINPKEFIGISSYADSALSNFEIRKVSELSTLDSAKTAVNDIVASTTDSSALGDGLRLAYNQITANETYPRDSSLLETIILLADGDNNYGLETSSEVLHDLMERKINIWTIGLGNTNDSSFAHVEDSLQYISMQTVGKYRNVENPENLNTYFVEYAAGILGNDILYENDDSLLTTIPFSTKKEDVYIDTFSNEVTFIVHWPKIARYFDLKLIKPDSSIIDSSTTLIDSLIFYTNRDYYKFYRISKPDTGLWQMIISAKKDSSSLVPTKLRFTSQVLSKSPFVSFDTYTLNYKYIFPKIPVIVAYVFANDGVAGASVSGEVLDPNGNHHPIKLFDDGQYSHGDERANDGTYSNRFLNFSANGSYKIHIVANNENGVHAKSHSIPDSSWVQQPIAPFTRVSKRHITITGINPASLLQPNLNNIIPTNSTVDSTIDKSINLQINGANFVTGANVLFTHPDIFTRNITVTSDSTINVDIRIPASSSPGSSDITVINPGGKEVTLTDAFTLNP